MTTKHEKKRPLTPRLRFPEFRDAGEWKENQLDKHIEEFRKTSTVQDEFEVLTSARGGLIKQKDYYENSRITERNNIGFNIIPINYLTYRSRSDDRQFFFNENNLGTTGIVSIYYPVFRISDGCNNFFLELLSRYSETIGKHSIGTSQTVLSLNDFKKIKLPLPVIEEQQKIADCLSTLDERITVETHKLDTLKAHKKGLLAQLFPAEGETVPRLRFPEFRNAGEWKKVHLGSQTTKVGSGITPRGGDKNYTKMGRPFIRSQNVGWGELILDDVVFIAESTHETFSSTEIMMNDVLLNITGASIGRCAVAGKKIAGGNVNQHVCIIRTKPRKMSQTFLMQYILSKYGQEQIDSFQAGGNRQGLNFAQVKSFSIPIPPQPAIQQKDCPEQQRIADCLSSLDALVACQTEKVNLLKTHKKGLLQQLFPTVDETLI